MYKRKDAFYVKAKKEGYRSRAAYKLLEFAGAEKVVAAGDFVIDAGAAPGGDRGAEVVPGGSRQTLATARAGLSTLA